MGEEAQILLRKALPGHGPGDAAEILEAVLAGNADILRGSVVVVAAYGVVSVLADPVDDRRRLETIVHEVAQAKTHVELLVDGLKSGPVGMKVGHEKYAHRD